MTVSTPKNFDPKHITLTAQMTAIRKKIGSMYFANKC
jgi:hypothetical protein